MVIQGTQLGAIQWVEGKTVQHVLASCTALQIFAIQVHFVAIEDNDITGQLTDPSITQLLDEYGDIFAKPKGLPPHSCHDHHIILKEGTPPINV